MAAAVVVSVFLQAPGDAVKINANSQILKKDQLYQQIFDAKNPLKLYLNAVLIVKAVETYLQGDPDLDAGSNYLGRSKPGGKYWWMMWHLACYVAQIIVAPRAVSARSIAEIDIRQVDDQLLD